MNELEMLEQRLRSWTPRRPSRTLEARIFGERSVVPRAASGTLGESLTTAMAAFRLPVSWGNWLAPMAVGCVVLAVVSFSEMGFPPMMGERGVSGRFHRVERDDRLLADAALSNRQMVAYYTTESHSAWNHWWSPILGWTNTLPVP